MTRVRAPGTLLTSILTLLVSTSVYPLVLLYLVILLCSLSRAVYTIACTDPSNYLQVFTTQDAGSSVSPPCASPTWRHKVDIQGKPR